MKYTSSGRQRHQPQVLLTPHTPGGFGVIPWLLFLMAFTALTAILLALKAPKPTVPSNDHSPRYDDLISGAEAAHIQCANVIDPSSRNAPKFFLAEFLPPRSVKS